MRTPHIRAATSRDLAALLGLEVDSFGSDRISRRSFRHFLRAPTAALRVADGDGQPAAYALVLFRSGSRLARLYSVAVAPAARGRGIAARLLGDVEALAAARGADRVSLEVRDDNAAAIRLYERLGYQPSGRIQGYYEDGGDARRYVKHLDRPPPRRSRRADA